MSLSFLEVNEQLETSLAIEVPDESERNVLSASSINFHCEGHKLKPIISLDEDTEMLDILWELADEHKSFSASPNASTSIGENVCSQRSRTSRTTVTTPILGRLSSMDSVEDLPFDDDSILGTQSLAKQALPSSNFRLTPSAYSSDTDDDEDRETLEMTQIFNVESLEDNIEVHTGELYV